MIPTLLFYICPKPFLSEIPNVDLEEFEGRWDYEKDPWKGRIDVAYNPKSVLESAEGDCDDYARMCSSLLYYHTEKPISLYAFPGTDDEAGHMIAYDGEKIYSSGSVFEKDIEEYFDENGWEYGFRRSIRGNAGPRFLKE